MKFSDLIPGIAESATDTYLKGREAKQKQRSRLEEILFQEQAKQRFDPDAQAKQELMRLIGSQQQSAEPQDRIKTLLTMIGRAPQPTTVETLAQIKAFQDAANASAAAPSQPGTPQTPILPATPVNRPKLYPGQVPLESGVRKVGRALGMRETPKALMESYQAKTAQAARGLGDTANVAVEERKMLIESFPRDGESYEARTVRDQSLNEFFDQKESMLQHIVNAPPQQILKGVSSNGRPRYEVDPVAMSSKKQASNDLSRLRQTRILYRQMYDEANRLMPAIGSPSEQSGSDSPEVGGIFNGQRVKAVRRKQ